MAKQELDEKMATWALKNTCLSKEELEENAKIFYAISTGKEKIAIKDFETVMLNGGPIDPAQKMDTKQAMKLVRLYTNAIDINRDKFIELREYLLFCSFLKSDDPKVQFSFLFRVFDLDNNGSISKSELEKAIEISEHSGILQLAEEKMTKDEMKVFFKMMDQDSNGSISEIEFINGFMKLLNAEKKLTPAAE